MTLIAVEGRAVRNHRAEIARVSVAVSHEGPDRQAVLEAATGTHGRLVAEVRGHADGGAVATWESRSVHAYTYTEWARKRSDRAQVFRASASLQADFADLDVLSRWIPQVAELDGVTVGGVGWDLTTATRDRLLAEVRTEAARETRARAESYAQALGLGVPAVVALYESGLRPGAGAPGLEPPYPMAMAARAGGAGEPARFELEPPEIEVAVSLTADYEA